VTSDFPQQVPAPIMYAEVIQRKNRTTAVNLIARKFLPPNLSCHPTCAPTVMNNLIPAKCQTAIPNSSLRAVWSFICKTPTAAQGRSNALKRHATWRLLSSQRLGIIFSDILANVQSNANSQDARATLLPSLHSPPTFERTLVKNRINAHAAAEHSQHSAA
jgi:hypothetical protein